MEEQAVGVVTGEVYVSGALTAVQDGAPIRLFYEVLSEIVSDAGLRPYLPHRPDHHLIADAHLDARTAFDIERAHVAAAAVLIAYAGLPSLGVGTEVEVVREHGVPVVIVVERDRPVSRILLGNPAVVEVVRFADLAGLRRDLGAALGRITRRPRSQRARVTDDQVVRRFFASLEGARRLPPSGGRRAGTRGGAGREPATALKECDLGRTTVRSRPPRTRVGSPPTPTPTW